MSGWAKPPPVVIVAGSNDYLRAREVALAVEVAGKNGRRIERIDGGDRDELSRVLSSGGVFFADRILVVVSNPSRIDAKMVIDHHKAGDTSVALLLHHEGEIKKGPLQDIAKEIPNKHQVTFEEVPPWKAEETAIKFCMREVKRHKLTLSDSLASNLVAASGTDLGILSFEIWKAATLCRANGDAQITGDHLRQTVSSISEIGAIPVVEALATASSARVSKALASMRRTHAGDPTMKACALVGRNVGFWLHAASLLRQKSSVEEISGRLSLHPYVCKMKILPPAKKWGEKNLARLLTTIAQVERGVRSGHANPWMEFQCGLLRAIQDGPQAVK